VTCASSRLRPSACWWPRFPEQLSIGATASVYAIGSAESDALLDELGHSEASLPARFLDALLAATAGGASPDDVQAAAHCVALALGTIARQSGHAAIGDVFARLVQWLATVPSTTGSP